MQYRSSTPANREALANDEFNRSRTDKANKLRETTAPFSFQPLPLQLSAERGDYTAQSEDSETGRFDGGYTHAH